MAKRGPSTLAGGPGSSTRGSWFRQPGDESADRELVGRAIQVRRAELGLGRRALAERSGLSYPYVSEIENGKKPGSPASLRAIADALGLPLHELLARGDALGENLTSAMRMADADAAESPFLMERPTRSSALRRAARVPSDAPHRLLSASPVDAVEPADAVPDQWSVGPLVVQIRRVLDGVPPEVAEAALLQVLGDEPVRAIVRDELRRATSELETD